MKKIIVLLLAIVFLFLLILNTANAQTGSLQGKVTDGKIKEGIPFATIRLMSSEKLVGGTVADLNGNYAIKPIIPGKYGLCVTAIGHDTVKLAGIEIKPDMLSFQNIQVNKIIKLLETVFVYGKAPIENDGVTISCYRCYYCCGCFQRNESSSLNDTTVTLSDSINSDSFNNDRLEKTVALKPAELQIFPNPTTQFIKVKSDSAIYPLMYRVVSVDGKIIGNGNINSSSDIISLANLAAGAYLIQLNMGQKWNTQKVIKL